MPKPPVSALPHVPAAVLRLVQELVFGRWRATGEELRVEPWLGYLEGKLLDAGLLTEPVRLPRT